MSLLSVNNLTIRRTDGVALLEQLNFKLDAGSRLGLVGESGSGKSLTALAILGLLPPGLTASGSVSFTNANGKSAEVIGSDENTVRTIRGALASIVFQEPLTALDPLMRIGNQLREPLKLHQRLRGDRLKAAIFDALLEVQLENPERLIRSFPHEISGGERQRVAIALALACKPQLLIADEPTTALDVSIQSQVISLLDSLVIKRNMAMLFISHDLAVVKQVTEQILVMQSGKVVEEGEIGNILRNPHSEYTKRLVQSAITLDSVLDFNEDSSRS